MSEQQKYLNIGTAEHPVTVWWAAKQADRVHVTTGDPRFTDENGEHAGLRIVFSANPRSADYNPSNFNRVARALAAADIPSPAPVPLHPRHLRNRPDVITTVTSQQTADKAAATQDAEDAAIADTANLADTTTDPAEFGWAACPRCASIVIDLDHHVCPAP